MTAQVEATDTPLLKEQAIQALPWEDLHGGVGVRAKAPAAWSSTCTSAPEPGV